MIKIKGKNLFDSGTSSLPIVDLLAGVFFHASLCLVKVVHGNRKVYHAGLWQHRDRIHIFGIIKIDEMC